jgi:hypothetical protein
MILPDNDGALPRCAALGGAARWPEIQPVPDNDGALPRCAALGGAARWPEIHPVPALIRR